jgi:hypothetical protein
MSRRNEMTERLDKTLSALEHLFLEATDKEILALDRDRKVELSDVRTLVAQQVTKHKQSLKRETKAGTKRVIGTGVKEASIVPIDVAGRFNLLRRLIATRTDLTPRLSSVFSGGRKPSDDEVTVLLEELIRNGIIKDRNRE